MHRFAFGVILLLLTLIISYIRLHRSLDFTLVHVTPTTTGLTRNMSDGQLITNWSWDIHTNRDIDYINVTVPSFLSDYRSPCWYEWLPAKPYPPISPYWKWHFWRQTSASFHKMERIWRDRKSRGQGLRLRCLPVVYQIGVMKCGTSDLFYSLTSHPDVIRPPAKEPNYWNQIRYGRKASVEFYLDLFDEPAEVIRKKVDANGYHRAITVDASVHYLFMFSYWRRLAGNKDREWPRYDIPHIIKHIVTNAKILAILRNPTERLYSEYLYFNQGGPTSNTEFHQIAEQSVTKMQKCLKTNSTESCIYNNDVIAARKSAKLVAGMYYPFLKIWTDVFHRENVHVITLEGYRENKTRTMKQVYKFLDLNPVRDMQHLKQKYIRNKGKPKENMLNKTRKLLDDFYKPWNRMLCHFMQQNKYVCGW